MRRMTGIKRIVNLIQSDLCRAFESKRILIGIAMVILTLTAASFEGISWNVDVLYMFSIVMYGMPAMVILIAGAFAYGDSICNDTEHKYMINLILKSNLWEYVFSKIVVIFISAVITICVGILCYVWVLRIFMPWAQMDGNQYETLMQCGSLRYFLGKKLFTLYFLLYGIQYGLLAGNLAVLSACLSLFITNKMLVLATPFLCYYFTDYVLADLLDGKINPGIKSSSIQDNRLLSPK